MQLDLWIRLAGSLGFLTGVWATQLKGARSYKLALLLSTACWTVQAELLDQRSGAFMIAWGGVRLAISIWTDRLSAKYKTQFAALFIALGMLLFGLSNDGQTSALLVLVASSLATYGYFCLNTNSLRDLLMLTSSLYVVYGVIIGSYEIALFNLLMCGGNLLYKLRH